jgi:hypothetical protein
MLVLTRKRVSDQRGKTRSDAIVKQQTLGITQEMIWERLG